MLDALVCVIITNFAILVFAEIVTGYGVRLFTPTAVCKFLSNRFIEEIRFKLFFFSEKIEGSIVPYVSLKLTSGFANCTSMSC